MTSVKRRLARRAASWLEVFSRRSRIEHDELKILAAKQVLLQQRAMVPADRMRDFELKVFSQFGDDGIIQYLLNRLALPDDLHSFIEFGVEDYRESNTRFLLQKDNWRGLVMDGDSMNVARIRSDYYYWRHDLVAEQAFITRDNINDLIRNAGFSGPLGILSMDIDGNDYWVWERIEAVEPIIVIAEYNSAFGAERAVSIPYDPTFRRAQAHFSHLYWGCSLSALVHLGTARSFVFVGCNSAGNNAYFINGKHLGSIPPCETGAGFVRARYRESRGVNGELTYLRGDAQLRAMSEMPLVDVIDGTECTVADLIG